MSDCPLGTIVATDDSTAAVLHLLAHLRSPGPENLHRPAYGRWIAQTEPELAAATASWLHRLQPLFECGDAAMEAQRAIDGDDEHREGSAGERLREARLAIAPQFAMAHERWRPTFEARAAELDACLQAVIELHPPLGRMRVEAYCSLGTSGRAMPHRILVGCPAPWNELDPATPAVVALHEALVRSSDGDYVAAEWFALTRAAALLDRGSQRLAGAFASWIGGLELGPLLQAVVRRGQIDAAVAQAIDRDRSGRPRLLARLG